MDAELAPEGSSQAVFSRVRMRLRDACEMSGSMSAWAREKSVPKSLVSEVLSGKREPPESLMNMFGYVRRDQWVPVKSSNY